MHRVVAPSAHPKEKTAELRPPPQYGNLKKSFIKMISFALCGMLSRQNQTLKWADD